MARFMEARGFSDYAELHRWSVEDLEGFWGAIWDWFELGERPETVLGRSEMPGAEWFPGAEVSYTEQVFSRARPGAPAIVYASESQAPAELSWDELADRVARCAAGLRRLGVERGDRVAAYVSNTPEAVIALPGHREHRRRLVELRAGVRHPDGGRPLQADRAQGPDRHRGLPLRRPRLRPARAGGRDRRRHPLDRAHGAGPERLGRPALGGVRSCLRAPALRPPALGALLVGHHRPAQGDRAGPGRHPARAPQEGQPPLRTSRRTIASSGLRPPAG